MSVPNIVESWTEGLKEAALACRVSRMGEEDGYFPPFHNGYVGVPKGHPWYGQDYMDIRTDAPGGLTYGRVEEDGLFWIGFDTNHSYDNEETQAFEPVKAATRKLAHQADEAHFKTKYATEVREGEPCIPVPTRILREWRRGLTLYANMHGNQVNHAQEIIDEIDDILGRRPT